jgi:hypothetical protein
MNSLFKSKGNQKINDAYMMSIMLNCEKYHQVDSLRLKITTNLISIPTIENYAYLKKYDYNFCQLKIIANHYRLKISGTKSQLINRIYFNLYFSLFITKIQKKFRGMLSRNFYKLRGPALTNRKICLNMVDFITMEPLENINVDYFFSYVDTDKFIYGFDLISLNTLFKKSKNIYLIQNPFNRKLIPPFVIKTITKIIRQSKIYKIQINSRDDDLENIFFEKMVELRAVRLFQNINNLGNNSDYKWFLSLNKLELIKFVKVLYDIWISRLKLDHQIKQNICPPYGDPFKNLSIIFINTEENIINIKKVILEVLEKMINLGINKESKTLGSYFVLGALTLINKNAASCLPLIYQNFVKTTNFEENNNC